MRIVKRDSESCVFDTSKIVDAISKAYIRQETKKVESEIREIELVSRSNEGNEVFFSIEGNDSISKIISEISRILSVVYTERDQENIDLLLELERLEYQRRQLRYLRKLKTARVSQMIQTAWMNRNHTAGRSNTGAVTDSMLLSLPTPPTSEAAKSSLRCGGNVIAYV